MKIEKRVYRLKNYIQNYNWGTKGENAFIPQLLGIKGEDKPYAELWIGAHPKLSSEIIIDNVPQKLNEVVEKFPEQILGKTVAEKFENKIPFLFKVLSAGQALSIQTHPNKEQAIELHQTDSKNYPDDNHKPEIAIALDYLKALVGFRSLDEIENNLNKISQVHNFIGEECVAEFMQTKSKDGLKKLFSALMKQFEEKEKLSEVVHLIKTDFEKRDKLTEDEELFLSLYNQYGVDIGLLVLFFLNVVNLKAGEAVYTPAGIPHAYIEGNIIECMANSDNVVRAGLTPKFKDVEQLVKILTYDYGNPQIIGRKISTETTEYSVDVEEFRVEKIELNNSLKRINTGNRIEILLVTEGTISIDNELVNKGESVLVPALLNNYTLNLNTSSVIFRVFIPA